MTPTQRHIAAMTGPERRRAREAMEKSQQEIATECGVSIGAVRNWENADKPATPQKAKAAKYLAALGVTNRSVE